MIAIALAVIIYLLCACWAVGDFDEDQSAE